MWKLILCLAVFQTILAQQNNQIPEYVKQCRKDDPELMKCFTASLEHLKPYLARGIPEIELPSVEPFKMNSLALQLTEGPRGYKINLKNMEAYGASNFIVKSLNLSENADRVEAKVLIPKLKISAKYSSSGVLLIIPASGSGDFHAVLEGCLADVHGKLSTNEINGVKYFHLDSLRIGINVDKIDMKISNAFNNNRILLEATNLFLHDNGQIVFEAMQPQMQQKLAMEFGKLANQLFRNVPRDWFYLVDV